MESDDYKMGYNLKTNRFGNMVDMGVIDSYNVVKQSLINGINLGSMLLSCELALV